MSGISIALAQLESVTGNPGANVEKILEAAQQAHQLGARLLLTPANMLFGSLSDLLLRADFLAEQNHQLERLAAQLARWPQLHVLVGHAYQQDGRLFNAVSLIGGSDGRRLTHRKTLLEPDEHRYFDAGAEASLLVLDGCTLGVTVGCETRNATLIQRYRQVGANALLCLDANPFALGQQQKRLGQLQACAAGLPVVYLNRVGAHDEYVYDGASFACTGDGRMLARLPVFQESVQLLTSELAQASATALETRQVALSGAPQPNLQPPAVAETIPGTTACAPLDITGVCHAWPDEVEQVYSALVLALKSYVQQAGFPGVVLGLSGGLDSALVLALAVDALGAERVYTLMMPSIYTAAMSLEDAQLMARGLGVKYEVLAIDSLMAAYDQALEAQFAGLPADTTEENLQARIRGNILMALSNKHGLLLVNTSNKSESAMGYSTLYGDMAGGFALLKDVPKTLVYALARWRNSQSPVIPQRIIDRPPSAELRADQTDQDSLPPYDILDAIIERYVDKNQTVQQIVDAGFDAALVSRAARLIRLSEYKRRQGAIGPKITQRAFGIDWRFPVVNGFNDSV